MKYNNKILEKIYELSQCEDNLINSYIEMMKKGSKIYIKPENRGKFTETMKRTGKSAEELSHSKNPLTRKRAIFALNAKKWKK